MQQKPTRGSSSPQCAEHTNLDTHPRAAAAPGLQAPAGIHFVHFTASDFAAKHHHGSFDAGAAPVAPSSSPPADVVFLQSDDDGYIRTDSPFHPSSLSSLSSYSPTSPLDASPPTAYFASLSSALSPVALPHAMPFFEPQSLSPSDSWAAGLFLVDEPSWFPPLDMSTSYDNLLFAYCMSTPVFTLLLASSYLLSH